MKKVWMVMAGVALTCVLGALTVKADVAAPATVADAQAMIQKASEVRATLEPQVVKAAVQPEGVSPLLTAPVAVAAGAPVAPTPRDIAVADAIRKGDLFLQIAEQDMARATEGPVIEHAYRSARRAAFFYQRATNLLAQDGGK